RQPGAAEFDLKADLLQCCFQILRALVFLHPRLAEVVKHVTDRRDRLGVAIDRLEPTRLGSEGESAVAGAKPNVRTNTAKMNIMNLKLLREMVVAAIPKSSCYATIQHELCKNRHRNVDRIPRSHSEQSEESRL